MNASSPTTFLSTQRASRPDQPVRVRPSAQGNQSVASGCLLLVASLFWGCFPTSLADIEQAQMANIRLTKTFHGSLNHHDWRAVEKLCAETIRYRGRATHFAEVDEPKNQFLRRYRSTLTGKPPGSLEIRQMYPAGAYHVIVEGVTAGQPPDTTQPVCLIYTIENNHITRLYAY